MVAWSRARSSRFRLAELKAMARASRKTAPCTTRSRPMNRPSRSRKVSATTVAGCTDDTAPTENRARFTSSTLFPGAGARFTWFTIPARPIASACDASM